MNNNDFDFNSQNKTPQATQPRNANNANYPPRPPRQGPQNSGYNNRPGAPRNNPNGRPMNSRPVNGSPNSPNRMNNGNLSREEYMRRLEEQRRAQGQETRPRYRKKKHGKPNAGVILFALMICGVIGVSAYHLAKNPVNPPENDTTNVGGPLSNPSDGSDGEGETQSGSQTNPTGLEGITPESTDPNGANAEGPDTPPVVPLALYDIVSVPSADINKGDLILVNYEHFYALADEVSVKSVYENKTSSYNVSSTKLQLTDAALTALNNLSDAFEADTGLSEILIVSGYRSTTDQEDIYASKAETEGEEYAKLYVANPGYSEHHTGMACDLSFYTAAGASIPVSDHDYGYWLNEHCAEYGYVLRYPDAKVDITKIGYEPWHYRYVGSPHAAIIMKQESCLEEYIDYVKAYTPDTTMLHALSDGTVAEVSPEQLPSEGYLIYYVPAAVGDNTEIRIPMGHENYVISGNNVDGFIVTVTLG